MDSSSSSDDEAMAACLAAAAAIHAIQDDANPRRGSQPGRARNKELGVVAASVKLDRDYFCRLHSGTPIFSEQQFQRTYRMPRELYEEVRSAVIEGDPFFLPHIDAAGKEGGSTDLKFFAALQMLSDGRTAASLTQQTRMSERQVMKCMKLFVNAVVERLGEEWLRLPTVEEIMAIEGRYRKLGFPGCLGAIDCAGWDWDLCPVAWQGLYKGKDKKPSMRMEVYCDDSLRIWSLNFGIPGSKNDRTIMDQSPFLKAVRQDRWPTMKPSLCIAGYLLKRFYFLVDGIYPRYPFFALPLTDPKSAKQRRYSQRHNSARKAVERVFGVLFKRFRILYDPCRLWNVSEISTVLKACVVLHNMIGDKRQYTGTMRFLVEDEELDQCRPLVLESRIRPECTYEQSELWRKYLADVESEEGYADLEKALIDNIWNVAGEEE